MFEFDLNNDTVEIKSWFDAEYNEWLASKSINGHIVTLEGGFETKEEAERAVS